MVILLHPGDSVKEILSHLTCFFYVQRASLHYYKKAENERRIQGVSICRRAPRITNLLFVDDSVIFCQANTNVRFRRLLRFCKCMLGPSENVLT